MSNSIKDSAQAFAVNQVLKYVDSNPQEAFPKLLDWADKFDKDMLKERLLEQFPDSEICIAYIGPIIGAHTGPGALALIYWGNNR